ncbi:MAG: hypothetical protein AB7F75_07830 [Planctomycetota bacterium]
MTQDPFEQFRQQKKDDKFEKKPLPDDHVGMISNYFSPAKKQEPAPAPTTAPAAQGGQSAVKRLEALTALLIQKGLITEDELQAMSRILRH